VQFLHLKERVNASRRLGQMLTSRQLRQRLARCVSFLVPICALAQERSWSVSPCELLKHPGMYTETLVSVPGMVLVGAQEFTSHGYAGTEAPQSRIRVRGKTWWKISRRQTRSQTYIRKSRFSRIALPQQTGMIVSFARAKRLRNPKNSATSEEISPHQLSCRSDVG